MSIAAFPDNAINKELYSRLNNLNVAGVVFPLYVSSVVLDDPKNYIFVNTQINMPQFNKCGDEWQNITQIQIVTRLSGHQGSKKMLNLATQEVITALYDFSLPVNSGLKARRANIFVENELVEDINSEIIYRKILRLECYIR